MPESGIVQSLRALWLQLVSLLSPLPTELAQRRKRLGFFLMIHLCLPARFIEIGHSLSDVMEKASAVAEPDNDD